MTDNERGYAIPDAFRRGVGDRLKQQAKVRHRPLPELRREFLFQRFLARVFSDPASPWVLKGGAGLLVRFPGARYSRDLDLLYRDTALDLSRVVGELRSMTRGDAGDYLTFVIDDPVRTTDAQTLATIAVTGYIGATRFDRFSIDLSTRPHIIARLERVRPEPVVLVPGLPALPRFILYPLPDQVADKVCAMYTGYGPEQIPSTRYRDLVDLVLIVTTGSLDAEPTIQALQSEARRRNLVLPSRLHNPGPQWHVGYTTIARDSIVAADLRNLDIALETAGRCLNPLLSGAVRHGLWDPRNAQWTERRA